MKFQHIIGIDEAGRGPLAGPVAVGAVVVPVGFDWRNIGGVDDSKKLSPKDREAIFRRARELKKQNVIDYRVSMVSAKVIDRIGISRAVRLAIHRSIFAFTVSPERTYVKLDGLLRAPEVFRHQKTIIGGDGSEKEIGLGSILAKVTRDRYMVRIAAKPQFAPYSFETHKGYGTNVHRACIRQHGLSEIHRVSYCKNLLK